MALAPPRRAAATAPPPSGHIANLPTLLGPKWRALTDVRLAVDDEFAALDLVILHPKHGIALVVVGREFTLPDLAIRIVRSSLREDGFGKRFAGFLPVVFLDVTEKEFSRLPSLLTEAFRREASLELRHAGWTDAALDAIGRCTLDESQMKWEPAENAPESPPASAPAHSSRRARAGLFLGLGAAAFIVGGAAAAVIGTLSTLVDITPAHSETARTAAAAFVSAAASRPAAAPPAFPVETLPAAAPPTIPPLRPVAELPELQPVTEAAPPPARPVATKPAKQVPVPRAKPAAPGADAFPRPPHAPIAQVSQHSREPPKAPSAPAAALNGASRSSP
jgi:hypothetical protein